MGRGRRFPPTVTVHWPLARCARYQNSMHDPKGVTMLKLITRAQARLASVRDEETGATATEYALIIGVASIAIVTALALIAPAITDFVNTDIVSRL